MQNLPPAPLRKPRATPVADMVTPALVREYVSHRVEAALSSAVRPIERRERLHAVVDELIKREVLD